MEGKEPYAASISLSTPKGKKLPEVGETVIVLVDPDDPDYMVAEV